MRLSILLICLFLAANVLLCVAHIKVFQGNWPFAAFGTIGLHLIGLLFFPYFKLFRAK